MNIQHTPTQHSNLVGGSSAGRVLACPASVRLSQKMPPQPSSKYADEGTALHNAVEYCLYEQLSDVDGGLADHLEGREFFGITLNREQAETVVKAVDMFDDIWNELVDEDGEEPVFAIETQVAFPRIPDAFGTADLLMKTSKRSIVLDWKFGAGVVVTAYENRQMAFYARGAAHSAPAFFWPEGQNEENGAGTRRVEFIVAQPRISEEPSRWQTNFKWLKQFEDDLVAAVAEVDKPDARVHRGEHCRWCAAQPICPAYENQANELADLLSGAVQPLQEEEDMLSPEELTVCTPDVLAEWLARADIVEGWAKSVRTLAMEQAEQGNCPSGMKLVKRYGNLSYCGTFAQVDKMLANKGLRVADRRKVTNITPTQANKLLKRHGKKQLTERHATRREIGHALVAEDDPRPAVRISSDAASAELANALRQSIKDS